MNDLRLAGGLLLMVTGMVLLAGVAALDMARVRPTTWVERQILLMPLGILLLLGGAALARPA